MTLNRIRLMADYGSFPLWNAGGGDSGNIDPHSLPLSDALCRALSAWADAFDATLNEDDPVASGFASDDAARAFAVEGERLHRALLGELGPDVTVSYTAA